MRSRRPNACPMASLPHNAPMIIDDPDKTDRLVVERQAAVPEITAKIPSDPVLSRQIPHYGTQAEFRWRLVLSGLPTPPSSP